mmetsp:Transcript_110886/g.345612  ORF Transcript_110886/g.345612 Transcript_110886/m.345612 type:complete len:80 (-) Transcript_110886:60-299(-)
MLDKIKLALGDENFNQVLACAVALDWSPLKVFCVRFAEASKLVWDQFQQGKLSPEVMHELRAVWPKPDTDRPVTRSPFY